MCTQGPGAHLSARVQGLDLVLGHRNRARILARILQKRCVHISAQRVNAPIGSSKESRACFIYVFNFFYSLQNLSGVSRALIPVSSAGVKSTKKNWLLFWP